MADIYFKIPNYFDRKQLFGSEGVTFTHGSKKLQQNLLNPKQDAIDYCQKINGETNEEDGGIIRLSTNGCQKLAYIVIDLKNQKQVSWAKKEKEKRLIKQEKFHGEHEEVG